VSFFTVPSEMTEFPRKRVAAHDDSDCSRPNLRHFGRRQAFSGVGPGHHNGTLVPQCFVLIAASPDGFIAEEDGVFYAKNGFVPDGARQPTGFAAGGDEIRLVR